MKKDENRNVLKYIEIILLIIVIALIIFLIVLELMHNEYSIYEREYDYNAYKVNTEGNIVTVTLYHQEGNRVKTEEKFILENGEIAKKKIKYYYERISIAKDEYNEKIKMLKENLNSGSVELPYTLEKDENAVVYSYDDVQMKEDDINQLRISNEVHFDTNDEMMAYIVESIDELYGQYYKKVN